jgi:hypothetical protein
MSRIFAVLVVANGLMFLLGCGSDEKTEAPAKQVETQQSKSSKPFAMEQQLIKDAGEVQGILDKNAEAKKKAIKDSN